MTLLKSKDPSLKQKSNWRRTRTMLRMLATTQHAIGKVPHRGSAVLLQHQLRDLSAAGPVARPPVPDFTFETATLKVRAAEDAWNSRDPKRVAQAYTVDSAWRNRSEFVHGRGEIEVFLTRKWEKEHDYRLIKELFASHGNRIAVRFAYEWHDHKENQWYRSYGNENWVFDDLGYMARRYASINDVPIRGDQRKFHWPHGTRPIEHPSLSELGL